MKHGGRPTAAMRFSPNSSLPNFPSMAHLQPISVSCHDILFFLGSKPFQFCLGRAEVQFSFPNEKDSRIDVVAFYDQPVFIQIDSAVGGSFLDPDQRIFVDRFEAEARQPKTALRR